jgi:hypothetical protein
MMPLNFDAYVLEDQCQEFLFFFNKILCFLLCCFKCIQCVVVHEV